MAFSVGGFFSKLGSVLHNFFTHEAGPIQAGISEALAAATVVAQVATIADPTGSAALVAEIGKVKDGLSLVSKGVTAASTATDLNGHAAALTDLVTGLVTSGDINVKNAQTQAAIGVMATKVQGVVGVLETAAGVAPKAA